jgi:hypothetical protein
VGVITPPEGVIILPVWCDHYSCFSLLPSVDYIRKFCSAMEWGAEPAPARWWLRPAGWDLAWAARTGSGQMLMCSDIFAASLLWRGRLLTTGRLSCRDPIVVCTGRGVKVAVAGRSVAWACSGRCVAICVRVFSSVSHL